MPDFSKIWATNSPLPEFNFTDEEYLTGWDFVAAAPPTKNQFDAWFRQTDEKLKYLYDQLQNTASKLYPVGSVYISFNSADPSALFGGAWTRLKDTFLLANGDTYAANTTGGSATKTITVNNMPAHNHSVNSAGAHTHTASTASSGSHNHTASTGGAGGHTHSASTSTNGNHSHTRGSMNITGTFFSENNGGGYPYSGAFYYDGSGYRGIDGGDNDNARTVFDASRSWTGSTSTNGNHTHTITVVAVGNHTHSVSVANSGAHTHAVTVVSNGAHTHTTNNTGGGTPINIMPPYTTVYMWRRTA